MARIKTPPTEPKCYYITVKNGFTKDGFEQFMQGFNEAYNAQFSEENPEPIIDTTNLDNEKD